MLSKWHVHAKDYAAQLQKNEKVKISAVWDDEADRGKTWAADLGVEYAPDLSALLSRKDIQAVICDTPTTMHKEVLIAAARAGKHIFTEKVLGVSTEQAEEIAGEIKKAGVIFTISYPLRRDPQFCFAKRLVDEGFFGKIGMVRMRRSHGGVSDGWLPPYWFDVSKTGGGAMMDLGAHPMYILPWLCGKPKRVSGMLNNLFGTSSDENSVVTIEFENGIIGIGETSFVSYNTPDALEIYGSEATLLLWDKEMKIASKKIASVHKGYVAPDQAAAFPAPSSAITAFVDACLGLAPPQKDLDVDSGVIVSRLMELAYSSNQGNVIKGY